VDLYSTFLAVAGAGAPANYPLDGEPYNLKDDVGKRHNLAADKPETVSELRSKLVAWRQDLKAPTPTPNTEQGKAAPGGKKKKKKQTEEE
jgi:hypothetical protein